MPSVIGICFVIVSSYPFVPVVRVSEFECVVTQTSAAVMSRGVNQSNCSCGACLRCQCFGKLACGLPHSRGEALSRV